MKQQLESRIAEIVRQEFDLELTINLSRPDEQHGDFATNVALQLAGRLGRSPRDVAEQLALVIQDDPKGDIEDVQVAGPGFINVTLTNQAIVSMISTDVASRNKGRRVLLEYSCPNPFKELHTGHLYQTILGDALGRILESTGSTVYRANFGGDVGLHVAKCMYGILQAIGGEDNIAALQSVAINERSSWLSRSYVAGASAYEQDAVAKQLIQDINGRVYLVHASQDRESNFAQIYWECRSWSYTYFESFYASIDVQAFDKFYPESVTAQPGLDIVRKNTPGTFNESDGAIVFHGETVGLHTAVFITSKGLPTYQAKDLGVIAAEAADFTYDKRVIMTGNDQAEYMKVVFAALASFDAPLAAKQTHLVNGTVKFSSGQKMSSRLGNVTKASEVIEVVSGAVTANSAELGRDITLGAVKYSFLKQRIGGDIAFDINESIRLEGNSGPYLQYAHTRALSILRKAGAEAESQADLSACEADERSILRKLSEYPEIVVASADELMPHLICTYLYELAQSFNRFYENNRVVGDERQDLRLALVARYAETLKSGLSLLGIPTPSLM